MRPLVLPYPNIDPVALPLGPVEIKWYGLAYVAGLLLGWLYLKRLVADDRLWPYGRPAFAADFADDLFIWVAIGVVVGGRLGHFLLYEPHLFLASPFEIFAIWKGGMAFHGGLVGTILAIWLFARRRAVATLTVMDLVAASVPFGLFFGRIANFINAEVVGRETTVPWAMSFCNETVRRNYQGLCPYGDVPRHPSQLYEAALEGLATFLILRWLTHHREALGSPGLVGGAFLICYGAFRLFCELFKFDEYQVFGALDVTTGFLYCVPMIVIGALMMRSARPAIPV